MAQGPFLQRIRRSLASVVSVATGPQSVDEPRRRAVAIILSILIAFLLWITFSLREQYTVVVEMPLEIGRVPDGRALAELPPAGARVTIQGIGLELMRLRRSPPPLVINAVSDQVDVFAAASENPRLPSGLSVQSVSPSSINLNLEPEVTRSVPVRLINRVRPALDHDFLNSPRVTPDSVLVTGARSLVHPLVFFPTEPLEVDGVRTTFTTRVALSDTLRGLVRTDLASVEVTVPIGVFTEGTRDIEVLIEGGPDDAPPVVLLPSRLRATFRVPVDQYNAANRSPDFYAFVPFSSVMADTTGSLQPVVQLPPNLTIRDVRLDPRRIRYWVRID